MSVFFTSRNTGFKSQLDTSSIPPWYLAVYWVSLAFSYRNPNSFLIPGGSIENGSASSIASQHLVDRLSFCSWFWWVVPWHLLDTSSIPQLSTTISRHLPRQVSQYLSTPASVEIYWGSIYSLFAIHFSFLRSLSICPRLFISQVLSLSLQTSSLRFFKPFSSFSSLGKFLISHSSWFET